MAANTQTKVGPGHAIIRGPLAALLLIRLVMNGTHRIYGTYRTYKLYMSYKSHKSYESHS